ncbi:hypothetical protein DFP72DRAFT_846847 [Ephemerocybe angulata]|uniref:Uncharacterized protein n=1 Tax=Ephemerocybe angulata TaxID=980116 RepID=A0A8H6I193_9AGAR|nr:hypothetical protein DFP72DRAFT_846847 [Tulosesus angulatus]
MSLMPARRRGQDCGSRRPNVESAPALRSVDAAAHWGEDGRRIGSALVSAAFSSERSSGILIKLTLFPVPRFEDAIGIKYLRGMHLIDSKTELSPFPPLLGFILFRPVPFRLGSFGGIMGPGRSFVRASGKEAVCQWDWSVRVRVRVVFPSHVCAALESLVRGLVYVGGVRFGAPGRRSAHLGGSLYKVEERNDSQENFAGRDMHSGLGQRAAKSLEYSLRRWKENFVMNKLENMPGLISVPTRETAHILQTKMDHGSCVMSGAGAQIQILRPQIALGLSIRNGVKVKFWA